MTESLDVLIVGAGPTGLTLAAQLQRYGLRFRIVDKLADRGHESRALGVQARTLEIFQQIGCADALVARGNTTVGVRIHFDDRAVVEVALGDVDASDTRFPFILFVSQTETEAALIAHLESEGVTIERGVELVAADAIGAERACALRHADGRDERILSKYVVGCDGAHSIVRKLAGIAFEGDAYPQDFLLGDVEADGPLATRSINAFPRGPGLAVFFPLGQPRSWRVIAMSADQTQQQTATAGSTASTLADLQTIVDAATGGSIRLRDPAWVTHFRLHHRQTAHYRAGNLFLAGDAGHIHSPVGAQGMNTGIQDAWNLGWKLALVVRGVARPELLDSYEAERWPVGRFLLRVTDRVFTLLTKAVANRGLLDWIRRRIVPKVIPHVVGSRSLRTIGFRFVSELDIRYRSSLIVREGDPRLNAGPRSGDRFPDAHVTLDGRNTYLLQELSGSQMHLLLCGPPGVWSEDQNELGANGSNALMSVHRLTRENVADALVDATGEAFSRLGIDDTAQYLIRPDGYIAYRCAGTDLAGVRSYLEHWFPGEPPRR